MSEPTVTVEVGKEAAVLIEGITITVKPIAPEPLPPTPPSPEGSEA